jgi:cytochrome b involved in lipid metabolism
MKSTRSEKEHFYYEAIQRLIQEKERIILVFEDQVYDVTDFRFHPGF